MDLGTVRGRQNRKVLPTHRPPYIYYSYMLDDAIGDQKHGNKRHKRQQEVLPPVLMGGLHLPAPNQKLHLAGDRGTGCVQTPSRRAHPLLRYASDSPSPDIRPLVI